MSEAEIKINLDEENKQEVIEKTEDTINDVVNGKDSPIKTEEEAKEFLGGFFAFLRNGGFEKSTTEVSKKSELPKRVVAHNFAMHCLGTISDVCHIALDCIGDAVETLISVLAKVLLSGVSLIMRIAKRLVRIVTLNQTVKG